MATYKKIKVGGVDNIFLDDATTSAAGLLSASDKQTLDAFVGVSASLRTSDNTVQTLYSLTPTVDTVGYIMSPYITGRGISGNAGNGAVANRGARLIEALGVLFRSTGGVMSVVNGAAFAAANDAEMAGAAASWTASGGSLLLRLTPINAVVDWQFRGSLVVITA